MKKIYFLSSFVLLLLLSSCVKEDLIDQVLPEPEITTQLQTTSTSLKEGKVATSTLLASFDVELNNGTTDEKVVLDLKNNSENAVSYEWSFGNGDTSTDELPSYKYNFHGNYTITLKATAADGKVSEMSKEVVVLCIYGGGDHNF